MCEELSFNEYSKKVYETLNPEVNTWEAVTENALLGLAGEVGEICDALKKFKFQGHELDLVHIKKELGDTLYYLSLACDIFSTSLLEVAETNNEKLKKRFPNGFSVDESVHRNET